MSEFVFVLILVLIATVALAKSITIAGENERFAVFVLGRFSGYQGPGLVLTAPFIYRLHRLSVGDTGTLTSPEFARVGEVEFPVTNTGSLKPGQAIQIAGFDGTEPRLDASAVHAMIRCPKCGHEFS